MRSVEGDPVVWPRPRDVILYARSNYFYNNMFIIYLFGQHFDFINCFGLNPEKMRERLQLRFVTSYSRHII